MGAGEGRGGDYCTEGSVGNGGGDGLGGGCATLAVAVYWTQGHECAFCCAFV